MKKRPFSLRYLGHYQILEPLGKGGMGEVYLAQDPRLDRKVAIKVLPAELAEDGERLARFEQEARAAAALNHPHIAAVHDVGIEGDTHFMVQEYLEGGTLREQSKKGALPLKKALDLATEIAEALAAAHSAGIIHRDLKPENIFITKESHAKVLDFGLAKLTEAAPPQGAEASMSPTMLGTAAGHVMGTAGYMSPEQVEGKPVDHRADIFAFGCVLYEMVAGVQPFAGKSVPDTLSRVLHEKPREFTRALGAMPAELGRVTRKCLAKEPEERYQHADDLVVDLRAVASEVESGGVGSPSGARVGVETRVGDGATLGAPAGTAMPLPSATWKRAAPWAVAAAAIAVAVAAWATRPAGSADTSVVRFSIDRGQLEVVDFLSAPFAVSPDGRTIVYLAPSDEGEQLFRLSVDELEPTPIPDTYDARRPFFSPDGSRLGFFADGELKQVELAGGRANTICAVSSTNGSAVWGEDDQITYGLLATNDGLFRVAASGGTPVPLTTLDVEGGETQHANPRILPGGHRILYVVNTSDGGRQLQVVSLDSGQVSAIGSGAKAFYAATGHLLFLDAQQLFAVPFDVDGLRITGGRIALVDGIINLDLSPAGTLVYSDGLDPIGGRSIVKIDRQGEVEELPGLERGEYNFPVLSPDGTRLAFTEGTWITGLPTINIYEIERGAVSRLAPGWGPRWRGDGQSVVFGDRQGGYLGWRPLDRSGEVAELVSSSETSLWVTDVSPDDRLVAYYELHPETGRDIWMVPLEGEPTPQEFLVTPASERSAVFSPDGEWVAYMSDASGREEVYVRPYPAGQPEFQVSVGGGREPRWSADSTEIYYRRGRGLYAVPVGTEPEFRAGEPELLLTGRFLVEPGGRNQNYDVGADGNFYIVRLPEGGERINVVLNWFEELKQRVPAER